MKIRISFVSNSSSESFIIDLDIYENTFEIAKKIIEIEVDDLIDQFDEEDDRVINYRRLLKNVNPLIKEGIDPNMPLYFNTETNDIFIIKQDEGYYVEVGQNHLKDLEVSRGFDEESYDKFDRLRKKTWFFYLKYGIMGRPASVLELTEKDKENICEKKEEHEKEEVDSYVERIKLKGGEFICPICDKTILKNYQLFEKIYKKPTKTKKKGTPQK